MKRKYGNYKSSITTVQSIRIPIELLSRIDDLAQKSLTSRNAWIVKTLARASKYKMESV